MTNGFYGLSHNPFDKQLLQESHFFSSKDHASMMDRLDYLKDIRGFGVFTAGAGLGKSFALRCFAKSLNPNLHQMEYFCLSTISVTEFYKQLCHALGVESSGGKTAMFKRIQQRIYYLYKEKRKPLILAIDEAQYLNTAILKDLKMLMNHGYDSLHCFTLILSGEPHLNYTLEKPIHEALKQRITVHYNYQGLGDEEVKLYIQHKLSNAGGPSTLIHESAISAAHSFARGNPRLIDNVMSYALDLGAQMRKETIDAEVMMAAIEAQTLQ